LPHNSRVKRRLSPRAVTALQQSLLGWFRRHRRAYPWRTTDDPYRIWVAEMMLQQTRIAAVLPHYERFLATFSSVNILAGSKESEVLRAWSGLGYYSRARNLRLAAQKIVADHAGRFPRTLPEALALPGIGQYTAAAVLSIAYGVPLAALDGNVARVLARLHALRGDLRQPRRWSALQRLAQDLLSSESAGDWNQALMELGELVCTPQNPRCSECPVAASCVAHTRCLADRIPAPRRKPRPVTVLIAAAILRDNDGRVLLVRDPGAHDHVLFSRMWQFPAVQVQNHAEHELSMHLSATFGLNIDAFEQLPAAKHGVTFRKVLLLPFVAYVPRLPKLARTRLLALEQLGKVPVSSATRKIAATVLGTAP